jgi:hypothetical protein
VNRPRAVGCRWRAGRLPSCGARRRHGIVAQISVPRRAGSARTQCALAPSLLIFPRDPNFAAKAGPILTSTRVAERRVLAPRDYVLCTDEKTSIQARRRTHRPAAGPRRPAYVRAEYARKGARACLAARDVNMPSCSGGASIVRPIAYSSAWSRRSCASNPTAPLAECSDCRQRILSSRQIS